MSETCEHEWSPTHPQVLSGGGFEADEGIVDDINLLLRNGWTTQYSCQGDGDRNHRYILVELDFGALMPDPSMFDWCNTVTVDTYNGTRRAVFSSDDRYEVLSYTNDKIVWVRGGYVKIDGVEFIDNTVS